MGVDLCLWRARIGTFSQPFKSKISIAKLNLYHVGLCLRILLFAILAAQCVERNPGPRGQYTRSSTRNGSSVSNESAERQTDHQTPTNRSSSQPHLTQNQPQINQWLGAPRTLPAKPSTDCSFNELKSIMLSVQTTVGNVEHRLTEFEKSMKEIKDSNKALIENNIKLNDNMQSLDEKVTNLEKELKLSEERRERLEYQSRRENLRFYGFDETKIETWEETEIKVREYKE